MFKSIRQRFVDKNVQRQTYHGQNFTGNHVNKKLKVVLIQNHC